MDWTEWKKSDPDINWGSSDLEDIKKGLALLIKEDHVDNWLNDFNVIFCDRPINLINKKETDKIWQMIVESVLGNFS